MAAYGSISRNSGQINDRLIVMPYAPLKRLKFAAKSGSDYREAIPKVPNA